MTLDKRYDIKSVEKKWIVSWKKQGTYNFTLKDINYGIDTPPPFTSGTLHMGHVLDFTWIDILARFERMRGKNVYLPQGFDCHGLPTEMKVEREYGVSPRDTKKFIEKCVEWTHKAAEHMKEQCNQIGYSTDWRYEYRTMNDDYKRLVQKSLLKFYKKGLLYRAKHPVLFCTNCETALAKAEVGYLDKQGTLYAIDLPLEDKKGHITIATSRPEMMPACAAVFAHPQDERYKHLVGKKVLLPISGRSVSILADKDVDKDFGTGVVYLCTYGDEQDIAWQKRYKLPSYDIITTDGRMKNTGDYDGMTVLEARKAVLAVLEKKGLVRDIKNYPSRVLAHTERGSCLSPIELLPVEQWFITVKTFTKDIIADAKKIAWYPKKEYKRLEDWAKSLDWDWIISRQRTFGTPIPFWYCNDCGEIVPAKEKDLPVNPVLAKAPTSACPACKGKNLIPEDDVCDCWIDSSMSALKIAKFWEDDHFFSKTYPTSLRPQGYEIIRTWLFYTLFRSKQLTGKIPWKEAIIHGMVAGTDGRKMSKSFGNTVDPDDVLAQYGGDVVRQWGALPIGSDDFPFSWEELKHADKFLTKLWNISRFIENHASALRPKKLQPSDRWVLHELNMLKKEYWKNMDARTFGNALRATRNFIWHVFADYYIEMVKHRLYRVEEFGEDSKNAAIHTLRAVLKECLLMLAPFTPFIAEEIWHGLFEAKTSIHLEQLPAVEKKYLKKDYKTVGDEIVEFINKTREEKQKQQLSLGAEIDSLTLKAKHAHDIKELQGMLRAKTIVLKK
ncbi:valine--tRNA ligase [archaeon CG10_big_fil_rev_8_21_14_0_10_43_11]|nr:MAG: valine--tRNA ligase [archaeon CG10_big_fil_rev_8_21_14_0_10_43_11]